MQKIQYRERARRRPRNFWIAASVVLALLLGRWYWGGHAAENKIGIGVPVTVGAVLKKDVPVELTEIGVVEAYSTVAVNSQVSGILQSVHFTEGQNVKKGDLLFTIDPAPFEAALQQAQANLEMQRAQAENARSLHKRYDDLVKKDYVTHAQFDETRANALSLEAAVKAQEAAVANAALQLGYTRISAPLDGRTGDLLVKPGNLIKANDAASVMVRIHQIRPIFVRFSVPEANLPLIQREMASKTLQVTAKVKGDDTQGGSGSLTFVDNSVDRSTGMIMLKATFENEHESLWPGQFVEVVLTLSTRRDALVIPSQSVLIGQNGSYVYVINAEGRALNRDIKIEFTHGSETVVSDGLQAGEKVATDGQLNLSPGAAVSIKNGVQPGEDP